MGMSASQARLISLEARMSDTEYEAQQINQQRLTLSNQMNAVQEAMYNMEVPTPPSKIDFMHTVYAGKNSAGQSYKIDGLHSDGTINLTQEVSGPAVGTIAGYGSVKSGSVIYGQTFSLSKTGAEASDGKMGVEEDLSKASHMVDAAGIEPTDADSIAQLFTKKAKLNPSDFLVEQKVNYTVENPVKSSEGLDEGFQMVFASGNVGSPKDDNDTKVGYIGTKTEWVTCDSFEQGKNYKYNGNDEGIKALITQMSDNGVVDGQALLDKNADIDANNAIVDANLSKTYVQEVKNNNDETEYQLISVADILAGKAQGDIHEAIAKADYDKLPEGPDGKAHYEFGVADANTRTTITPSEAAELYIMKDGVAQKLTDSSAYDPSTGRVMLSAGETLFKQVPSGGDVQATLPGTGSFTVDGHDVMTLSEITAKYGDETVAKYIEALRHTFRDSSGQEFSDQYYEDTFRAIVVDEGNGKVSFQFCLTNDLTENMTGNATKTTGQDEKVKRYQFNQNGVYYEKVDASADDVEYDSNGNISKVRIDGQDVVFEVKQEVNELDYDAAVCEYKSEKAAYDQEQNKLNKQTSIYQRQDKLLELKLTRLDSERNALNTEIEAVKKIIQDSIDRGFKTFSG